MIKLLLEPVNFLILDEPTNHLDMRTKDVLKEAIRAFDGTVVLVSHDRDFLDGLVTKVYEFGGGRVREHLGGIYDYLHTRQIETLDQLSAAPARTGTAPAKTVAATETASSAGKLDYEQRKELQRQRRKLEKAVADAERRIGELEKDVAHVEAQMATPEGAADTTLYERHADLKKQLDAAMDAWEQASEALDAAGA